jgi:hypothetical protein
LHYFLFVHRIARHAVDLDLQQDSAEIFDYVRSRVSNYSPTDDHGPGGVAPVKMIYAGYNFDQRGWFALIFDRRADAAHDGEWTLYLQQPEKTVNETVRRNKISRA